MLAEYGTWKLNRVCSCSIISNSWTWMIHEFILPRTPVSLDAGLLNKRAKRKFHFNDLLQKYLSSIEFERFIQEIIKVNSYTYIRMATGYVWTRRVNNLIKKCQVTYLLYRSRVKVLVSIASVSITSIALA